MPNPPIGVIAAAIAMLVIAGLSNHYQEPGNSYPSAQQHPKDALQSVAETVSAPVPRQKTPPANPEPKRDEWRTESDLEAQWYMAWGALAAAIAAFAGVVVTGFGVWYVRKTLLATQATISDVATTAAAAVEANRMMREDRRPWIDFQVISFENFHWAERTTIMFHVTTENLGKSIAVDGHFVTEVYEANSDKFPEVRDRLMERYRNWVHPGLKLLPGRAEPHVQFATLAPQLVGSTPIRESVPHAISICILFGYRDFAGEHTYLTIKNYLLLNLRSAIQVAAPHIIIRTGRTKLMSDANRNSYI